MAYAPSWIIRISIASNYGPSYGSAEETFQHDYEESFIPYQDELFISAKAGHDGPFLTDRGSGNIWWNSLNQSLKRMMDMGIFWNTVTIRKLHSRRNITGAAGHRVRQGKTCMWVFQIRKKKAVVLLPLSGGGMHCCSIRKIQYVRQNRKKKVFCNRHAKTVPVSLLHCPLAQGLLTNRYLPIWVMGIWRFIVAKGGFLKKEARWQRVLNE